MLETIPETVLKAFPLAESATHVRQLASPVPLYPDTTFDIFVTKSQNFLALVTTDHADPYEQSCELKNISGQYEFEFKHLLKPYDNGTAIDVLPHDKMSGNFFITTPYKKYKLYHYLAYLKCDDQRQ